MTSFRRWQVMVVALAWAWLFGAPDARAGKPLRPPDPSAPPVRVLLSIPAESGKLERQVKLLDRALADSRGFLLPARTLEEADVIVRFSRYRRTVNDKGVTQDWWDGEFRLLTPSAADAELPGEVSNRFSLLIIGRESWEVEPVVDLLARTMARALGRDSRPRRADSI